MNCHLYYRRGLVSQYGRGYRIRLFSPSTLKGLRTQDKVMHVCSMMIIANFHLTCMLKRIIGTGEIVQGVRHYFAQSWV